MPPHPPRSAPDPSSSVSPVEQAELARRWVDEAQRIVVLTGAGISTDSGIPDFRGPQGVWTRDPAAEKMSDIRYYLADPRVRAAAWQSRLHHPAWTARPNRGHLAIVELEKRGRLHGLITQNVDELHQIAGNSADKVVEVHGTVRRVMCWGCGARSPMPDTLARVRAGETDPACLRCGGILKSDTISFGQNLVPEVIDKAFALSREADLMLAVGSTLSVYPAAGVVPQAKEHGARVVILNAEPTAMDDLADVVIQGPIGELLPRICGLADES
ncbi:MAG: Sir2 family NAD-dependent protein deacetylase [Burkholderiaceae bacterium]